MNDVINFWLFNLVERIGVVKKGPIVSFYVIVLYERDSWLRFYEETSNTFYSYIQHKTFLQMVSTLQPWF